MSIIPPTFDAQLYASTMKKLKKLFLFLGAEERRGRRTLRNFLRPRKRRRRLQKFCGPLG